MGIGFLFDPIGVVASLVERWSPSACSSEKDYENSLYEFLHSELPDVQITKQYARGRTRVDIRIGTKVILELKTNLNSTGAFQRLLGQLVELRTWGELIVVVLTGETDPHFPKAIRDHVKEWDEFPFEPKVSVFVK